MPRTTHPRPRHRKSGAVLHESRDRIISKRWRQAKQRFGIYQLRGAEFIHPEEAWRYSREEEPFSYWLFAAGKNSNQLARNPWTRCSCLLCSGYFESYSFERSRHRREWQKEAAEALEAALAEAG